MKKFKISWGRGSVEKIKLVYKTMLIDAENIDSINPLIILPKYILKNVFYTRVIFTSETKRNVDYGSYVDFIEIEQIN